MDDYDFREARLTKLKREIETGLAREKNIDHVELQKLKKKRTQEQREYQRKYRTIKKNQSFEEDILLEIRKTEYLLALKNTSKKKNKKTQERYIPMA